MGKGSECIKTDRLHAGPFEKVFGEELEKLANANYTGVIWVMMDVMCLAYGLFPATLTHQLLSTGVKEVAPSWLTDFLNSVAKAFAGTVAHLRDKVSVHVVHEACLEGDVKTEKGRHRGWASNKLANCIARIQQLHTQLKARLAEAKTMQGRRQRRNHSKNARRKLQRAKRLLKNILRGNISARDTQFLRALMAKDAKSWGLDDILRELNMSGDLRFAVDADPHALQRGEKEPRLQVVRTKDKDAIWRDAVFYNPDTVAIWTNGVHTVLARKAREDLLRALLPKAWAEALKVELPPELFVFTTTAKGLKKSFRRYNAFEKVLQVLLLAAAVSDGVRGELGIQGKVNGVNKEGNTASVKVSVIVDAVDTAAADAIAQKRPFLLTDVRNIFATKKSVVASLADPAHHSLWDAFVSKVHVCATVLYVSHGGRETELGWLDEFCARKRLSDNYLGTFIDLSVLSKLRTADQVIAGLKDNVTKFEQDVLTQAAVRAAKGQQKTDEPQQQAEQPKPPNPNSHGYEPHRQGNSFLIRDTLDKEAQAQISDEHLKRIQMQHAIPEGQQFPSVPAIIGFLISVFKKKCRSVALVNNEASLLQNLKVLIGPLSKQLVNDVSITVSRVLLEEVLAFDADVLAQSDLLLVNLSGVFQELELNFGNVDAVQNSFAFFREPVAEYVLWKPTSVSAAFIEQFVSHPFRKENWSTPVIKGRFDLSRAILLRRLEPASVFLLACVSYLKVHAPSLAYLALAKVLPENVVRQIIARRVLLKAKGNVAKAASTVLVSVVGKEVFASFVTEKYVVKADALEPGKQRKRKKKAALPSLAESKKPATALSKGVGGRASHSLGPVGKFIGFDKSRQFLATFSFDLTQFARIIYGVAEMGLSWNLPVFTYGFYSALVKIAKGSKDWTDGKVAVNWSALPAKLLYPKELNKSSVAVFKGDGKRPHKRDKDFKEDEFASQVALGCAIWADFPEEKRVEAEVAKRSKSNVNEGYQDGQAEWQGYRDTFSRFLEVALTGEQCSALREFAKRWDHDDLIKYVTVAATVAIRVHWIRELCALMLEDAIAQCPDADATLISKCLLGMSQDDLAKLLAAEEAEAEAESDKKNKKDGAAEDDPVDEEQEEEKEEEEEEEVPAEVQESVVKVCAELRKLFVRGDFEEKTLSKVGFVPWLKWLLLTGRVAKPIAAMFALRKRSADRKGERGLHVLMPDATHLQRLTLTNSGLQVIKNLQEKSAPIRPHFADPVDVEGVKNAPVKSSEIVQFLRSQCPPAQREALEHKLRPFRKIRSVYCDGEELQLNGFLKEPGLGKSLRFLQKRTEERMQMALASEKAPEDATERLKYLVDNVTGETTQDVLCAAVAGADLFKVPHITIDQGLIVVLGALLAIPLLDAVEIKPGMAAPVARAIPMRLTSGTYNTKTYRFAGKGQLPQKELRSGQMANRRAVKAVDVQRRPTPLYTNIFGSMVDAQQVLLEAARHRRQLKASKMRVYNYFMEQVREQVRKATGSKKVLWIIGKCSSFHGAKGAAHADFAFFRSLVTQTDLAVEMSESYSSQQCSLCFGPVVFASKDDSRNKMCTNCAAAKMCGGEKWSTRAERKNGEANTGTFVFHRDMQGAPQMMEKALAYQLINGVPPAAMFPRWN